MFDELDIWKDLSEAINVFLKDSNIFIVVKFHPNQNEKYLNKYLNKYPTKKFFSTNSIDTNSLIYFLAALHFLYPQ